VLEANVHISTQRLQLAWNPQLGDLAPLLEGIARLGYTLLPPVNETLSAKETKPSVLLDLAVAGFASANIMLFSVSIWAGYWQGIDPAIQHFFYWICALIAIPASAFSGRSFFKAAFVALKNKKTTMDIPIAVGIILVLCTSVINLFQGQGHAYFESAVMLIFFLLIGRFLEENVRNKAKNHARLLIQAQNTALTILENQDQITKLRADQLKQGMILYVAAGERIGADGEIIEGSSELDTSLVTGEMEPKYVQIGAHVYSGMLNLTSPLKIRITQSGQNSLLAHLLRLIEKAEQTDHRFKTLSDRIAYYYTPSIHGLAALTGLGWFFLGQASWQFALNQAAAVLLITCPCALALAIPMVNIVALSRLLKKGIIIQSSTALERLRHINMVIFDKTGTLTQGKPTLIGSTNDQFLAQAASLAVHSHHFLSKALVEAARSQGLVLTPINITQVEEKPGYGLESCNARLGRPSWASPQQTPPHHQSLTLAFYQKHSHETCFFFFEDPLRPDIPFVFEKLHALKLKLVLLSGDHEDRVKPLAQRLNIPNYQAHCLPQDKQGYVAQLHQEGNRALMIGDGLNDAPALKEAFISMSPGNGIDITQSLCDILFQGKYLSPLLEVLGVSKKTHHLIIQNLTFSLLYNVLLIPLAIAGKVNPLIASIAMSASSLVVTLNSLRGS
jgi:Cu2+-exporting ATPase